MKKGLLLIGIAGLMGINMMFPESGYGIERKSCEDQVFTVKIGDEVKSVVPSLERCFCSDKGIFCSEDGKKPITDYNLFANCLEVLGIYGKYCLIYADDNKSPLFIRRGKKP